MQIEYNWHIPNLFTQYTPAYIWLTYDKPLDIQNTFNVSKSSKLLA